MSQEQKVYIIREDAWSESSVSGSGQDYYFSVPINKVFLNLKTAQHEAKALCKRTAAMKHWVTEERIEEGTSEIYYVASKPENNVKYVFMDFYDWIEYRIMEMDLCDTVIGD